MKKTDLTVLVVDAGGRGSALGYAIAASPLTKRVIFTPGNGGVKPDDCFYIKETDLHGIRDLAWKENVDFVVFGPEAALAAGGVDYLRDHGIRAFGPAKDAAMLETSKAFMKSFCLENKIPTAPFKIAHTIEEAVDHIKNTGYRVIKASGLAGGKGVVVAETEEETLAAATTL